MIYLGLINQYDCIWHYRKFQRKKAMHKKNICNQVCILNRNDLMEAISGKQNHYGDME